MLCVFLEKSFVDQEKTFAILREIIILARRDQIKTVKTLKSKIRERWPDADAEINAALRLWAARLT